MRKLYILFIVVFFLPLITFSQNPKWLIGSNGLMALCDSNGDPITEYEYELINDFHDGLAAVSKKGKWGFVGEDGNMQVKNKYSETFYFSEGYCPVTKNGNEWFFINEKGKKSIKSRYQFALPFGYGLAPVKKNNLWGFINEAGEFRIPAIYESANIFSDDLSPIRNKGLWGYINSSGRLVIPFIFEQANIFIDGEAKVMKDGKIYRINTKGQNLGQVSQAVEEEKIYKLADKMPVFPGGYNALFDYLDKNLQYPGLEKQKEVEGIVRVSFVVDTTGLIKNIKIVNGLTAHCDVEAMRLIKNMPAWEPGLIDNKKVNVQLLLNVEFKLQ